MKCLIAALVWIVFVPMFLFAILSVIELNKRENDLKTLDTIAKRLLIEKVKSDESKTKN